MVISTVAVERAGDTDTDIDTVQEQRATDHRPPPDNPGAEGAPSRADSRAGAANDIGERPQASRPETAEQQETSGEQDSATDEDGPDASTPSHATAATIDAAEEQRADARPALRDPPESEPEAPSRADSRAAAAAANTEQVSTSDMETSNAAPGQTGGSTREVSGASPLDPVARTEAAAERQLSGERLMVGGKPLREHLDPVGAAAWSNDVGDQPPDPTDRAGDKTVNPETDEQPRAEKLRSKFHREGTDAVETAGKAAGKVKDILSHSPTGHLETRTGPTATSAPLEGISVGDTATALIAGGVMVAEFGRLIHEKFFQEKET
jgi:hypothetical protein